MVILPGCKCCGDDCEICCRTVSYGYKDTVPPGKWYDECPNVGTCSADNGPAGSCAGQTIEGHIVERFCKSILEGKDLHAKLLKGSAIDDYGEVAGIATTQQCGVLGVFEEDHDITGSITLVDDPDDSQYKLAKIPFKAINSRLGGPMGAAGVRICWCCTEQDAPTPVAPCECCNEPPPPPPPPPVCCCVNGIITETTDCIGNGGSASAPKPQTPYPTIKATFCGVQSEVDCHFKLSDGNHWIDVGGPDCDKQVDINGDGVNETIRARDAQADVAIFLTRCNKPCNFLDIEAIVQTSTRAYTYVVPNDLYMGSVAYLRTYLYTYKSGPCGTEESLTYVAGNSDDTLGIANFCGDLEHYVCPGDDPVVTLTISTTPPQQ